MKKLLLLALFFANVLVIQAQSVAYTYRPFAEEGCSVSFTPTIVNDTAYIVVDVQSDRLVFPDNTTMLLRFFGSEEVLQLSGKNLNANTSQSGVLINHIMVPITEINARAMFRVTEEQMAMFEKGVSKIRITTIPITHERTFEYDRIGERIYQNYKEVKSKNKDF